MPGGGGGKRAAMTAMCVALVGGVIVLSGCHGWARAGFFASGFRPGKAELLLASDRDGNSEIYLVDERREWRNLTQHPGEDGCPEWSPDGTRIVFQSRRDGNLDIWTMAADGSDQRRLTDDPDDDCLPAYTPDGRFITFTSMRRESSETERQPHLYVMRANGKGQRRMLAPAVTLESGVAWSPEGATFAVALPAEAGRAHLYVGAITYVRGYPEVARLQRLMETGESEQDPSFSPAGGLIAFCRSSERASELIVIGRDGSFAVRVRRSGWNRRPRWSADGQWLVFSAAGWSGGAGRPADRAIYACAVEDGATPVLIADSAGDESGASWRP